MVGSWLQFEQFEQFGRVISIGKMGPLLNPKVFTFEQAKDTLEYLKDQNSSSSGKKSLVHLRALC